jgi:CDP-diacylglycerol--glycerol-3-phosphate 3-phosphatidyltransferase
VKSRLEADEKYSTEKVIRAATLLQLRHQSRWAALLLFSTWLSTVFFCSPIVRDEPATIAALLPGLAVAIHLYRNLSRHLSTNHRALEEDRLFPSLGAANWITLLRADAIVLLAGFLPIAIITNRQGWQYPLPLDLNVLLWVPGIIYLVISLADLFDGFIARRQGRETELGKKLDIETDAAGLLVASLPAVALGRLPAIYLLVGLAYYLFIFGIQQRQRRGLPVIALQSRPYARIIAGFQMGLVGMALLPIFNPAFTFMAAYIFMTPLLIGFFRDWLVVSCRIKTDTNQQAVPDLWARSFMMKVPVALRLVILAGGIAMLVDYGVYQTHLPLQPAQRIPCILCILCIVGCLLAAAGFMGRSASLCLVLLLGSNLSPFKPFAPLAPFGVSSITMVVFSAAATLMLTGTGAMSLWAPEDRILYRRSRNQPMTNCEPL